VSFVHNPTNDPTEMTKGGARPTASWLISHLLSSGSGSDSLGAVSSSDLARALGVEDLELSYDGRDQDQDQAQVYLTKQQDALQKLTGGVKVGEMSVERYEAYVGASRLVVREMGALPGEQVLLVNGRVSAGCFLFVLCEVYLVESGLIRSWVRLSLASSVQWILGRWRVMKLGRGLSL